MTLDDIATVLADRAKHAGLVIPDELAGRLTVYFQVLSHWNRKINLTSLSDQDEAVDRLLLEPLAAAASVPHGADLIDLGSGGGSPAIPLALATGAPRVVMVESRVRKTAFLREALRELGLNGTVEAVRFEDVSADPRYRGQFPLLSIRAVRLDEAAFSSIAALLAPGGHAALFRSVDSEDPPPGLPSTLHWESSKQLIPASHSAVTVLRKL